MSEMRPPAEAAHRPDTSAALRLPEVGAARADFGGYAFDAVAQAPEAPGLFIVTKRVGARLYPLYAGEGADMAGALAAFRSAVPQEAGLADGLFVLERALERVRVHTLRDIVGRYNPPLNVAHRTGWAAPETTALVRDRAEGLAGHGEQPGAAMDVSEDDLMRLVQDFYGKASADPLLGPVFARAIPDWESHYSIVQDFWSRTLLGTTRYSGIPFAAHVSLQLRPEHFVRWVALFRESAAAVLDPVAAARAVAKVEHMSSCFQAGLFPPDLSPAAAPHPAPHA
ncbi:group III truncated hemoglobin [Xanthobacter sp. KR7-65]|uniref:group III truncated hemoglobin n=1 Tax=Xanthobacter sp. KR7-65 TaxID=3156612 RepID=UPI0032B33ADD